MVGILLNEDVVGQQVIVGEDQTVLLVFGCELVDEVDLLFGCPLLQLGNDGLLLGQEDVLAQFLVAETEDIVSSLNKGPSEQRFLLDLLRGGLEFVELAQRESHFLQVPRHQHFTGRQNGGLKVLFQPYVFIIVEHLGTQADVSNVHVYEDLGLPLEERIYVWVGLLSEDSPNLRKMMG